MFDLVQPFGPGWRDGCGGREAWLRGQHSPHLLPVGTSVSKRSLPSSLGRWIKGSAMREMDTLRERAAQLRALAIKARQDGKPLLADEITRLVIELSYQADALDREQAAAE